MKNFPKLGNGNTQGEMLNIVLGRIGITDHDTKGNGTLQTLLNYYGSLGENSLQKYLYENGYMLILDFDTEKSFSAYVSGGKAVDEIRTGKLNIALVYKNMDIVQIVIAQRFTTIEDIEERTKKIVEKVCRKRSDDPNDLLNIAL